MKPGLSLRMSQHLALTPQLQQSIRLLQLSTLDLAAEVEQMLDDNPFLERSSEDAPQSEGDGEGDDAIYSIANSAGSIRTTGQNDAESEAGSAEGAPELSELADFPDWGGDGSSDLAHDDSEWGGDAPARQQTSGDSGSDSDTDTETDTGTDAVDATDAGDVPPQTAATDEDDALADDGDSTGVEEE